MKCKRCSVDEDRIDGYCSEHCKEMAEAESRIAELEAENKGYRMLIQDWIDIFDPQFTKRISFIDGVRLAMIESIKEREE